MNTLDLSSYAVEDGAGTRFVPIVTDDGQVGFRVEWLNTGETTFIYFNPSTTEGADDFTPNVFVYEGATGEPWNDEALHFYDLRERSEFG